MGASLGYFSDDVRDFPELNKCPDCETFFADLHCPICGKECPEEMRAGNRKPIKVKKKRSSGGNGRVQFVPWYFSTWFIIAMLFTMPIVGLILTWLGYWKKIWKIVVTVLLVASYVLVPIASVVWAFWTEQTAIPVDLSLSKAEYITQCENASVEDVYRNAVEKNGDFVCLTFTVVDIWENEYDYEYSVYYECSARENGKEWVFLVRDWRQEDKTNLTSGDVIKVYGQVGGNVTISNYTAGAITAPCIDMLYLVLQ